MSLDVYLHLENVETTKGSGIFVRENGQTMEISRAEWDKKFPNTEPIVIKNSLESGRVYSANITHNLGKMAGEAKIYEYLWQPDVLKIVHAHQLVEPLEKGLELLKSDPGKFKAFNPSNGWGSYEVLVKFVENYLDACKKYPGAEVSVWR